MTLAVAVMDESHCADECVHQVSDSLLGPLENDVIAGLPGAAGGF